MGKILCAIRGGEASYRTQDAVIALAKERGDALVFLYVVDTEFISKTERAVRPDVVIAEMKNMGEFLMAMACERAEKQGIKATYSVKHGHLDTGLKEAAIEEKVTLVALGQPAGEGSRFHMASLENLTARIEQETGIEVRIV